MPGARRIAVLHGVNLDQLGGRDPIFYGDFTLAELERQIEGWAHELGLETTSFQTNHEGEYIEHLHRLRETSDGAILNPGSWTHYSWAIRDALELSGVPAVEVHISDVMAREEWRHFSVFDGLVVGRVYGKGAEGYREALEILAEQLGEGLSATAADGRAARLAELVAREELDLLFVSDLTNVRYLTGFAGTNGACLVGAGSRVFFTDFRYTERAAQEVGEGWERPGAERELLPQIAKRMKGRVGFEDGKLSVRELEKLAEAVPGEVELVAAGDLVEEIRAVKDPEEIERIAAAAALADEVYRWAVERALTGRTERQVARACEARIRELGAEPSFPPIVAAGPNGALPHAEPGEREIGTGELVVFDMGAQLDGYCSDCTRTFATGEPGEEARKVYELVRTAQEAALEAVRPGRGGREIDAVPRKLIEDAGHGERFGHGTGHGVGLEVHEGPRLAASSEDEIRAGNVVTVEPGVYVEDRFGVRIEDLVVVTEDGCRNLSGLPKELAIVE